MNKVLFFLAAISLSSPAYAYLDPGTGSALLSAIIGVFVAAGIAIKTYWYKFKSLFSKKSNKDNTRNS